MVAFSRPAKGGTGCTAGINRFYSWRGNRRFLGSSVQAVRHEPIIWTRHGGNACQIEGS